MESSITAKLATFSSEGIKSNQYLDFGYWFGYAGAAGWDKLILLIFLTLLVLIISLSFLMAKKWKKNVTPPQAKLFTKAGWYLLSLSLVGALLVVFRMLGVAFVSIRFTWILWFVALGFLGYILFRDYSQKLPSQILQYQSYLLKKKYLPEKKKKR